MTFMNNDFLRLNFVVSRLFAGLWEDFTGLAFKAQPRIGAVWRVGRLSAINCFTCLYTYLCCLTIFSTLNIKFNYYFKMHLSWTNRRAKLGKVSKAHADSTNAELSIPLGTVARY
jgi:hypothetical protein